MPQCCCHTIALAPVLFYSYLCSSAASATSASAADPCLFLVALRLPLALLSLPLLTYLLIFLLCCCCLYLVNCSSTDYSCDCFWLLSLALFVAFFKLLLLRLLILPFPAFIIFSCSDFCVCSSLLSPPLLSFPA